MKALQYERATRSPKKMHKGKERERKDRSVMISSPVGPTTRPDCFTVLVEVVVTNWIRQVVGEVPKKWWGKIHRKIHGTQNLLGLYPLRFWWECPGTSPRVGALCESLTPSKTTQLPISTDESVMAHYGH